MTLRVTDLCHLQPHTGLQVDRSNPIYAPRSRPEDPQSLLRMRRNIGRRNMLRQYDPTALRGSPQVF